MSGTGPGVGSSAFRRAKPKKHSCTLGLGSESMLPKPEGWFHPCRTLKKLSLIAEWHPLTVEHFPSHTTVLYERQRQILQGDAGVIHPYSCISFIWCSFMVVVFLVDMMVVPFRYAFIFERQSLHPIDTGILVVRLIGLVDVAVKANIGFAEQYPYNLVLSRKRIFRHYLRTWLLVDLVTSLPVAYLSLLSGAPPRVTMACQWLQMLRILRGCTFVKDLDIILKSITKSFIWQRCSRLVILMLFIMHCCICWRYFPLITNYYLTGELDPNYCKFLAMPVQVLSARDVGVEVRYTKAMFIAYSAFFGSGYRFRFHYWDELLSNSMIILIGAMFMLYTTVSILKIYLTVFSSDVHYGQLMNQLEKYMQCKQYPEQLKRRLRDFYKYRYQGKYFKEEAVLNCLSEQLRNEISLYSCQRLIELVPIFEGLPPSVVGAVVGCLKPEVFMTNDVIVRAGDHGSCMYFISSGTVALYSMKGAEVCHLGDGAHFGSGALLSGRKRVATVLALEITRAYRLDAHHFRQYVVPEQQLYSRIEALATKLMNETRLIDEQYIKENRVTPGSETVMPSEHSEPRFPLWRSRFKPSDTNNSSYQPHSDSI